MLDHALGGAGPPPASAPFLGLAGPILGRRRRHAGGHRPHR
ncbi:MAG: hypothetical protein EBR62_06130 [Verrucomicrobia bacterium]|nr:hypothetical protein [Verrucomicrobiota bacterium]